MADTEDNTTFVGVDQAQRVTGLCVLRPDGGVELSELRVKSRGPDRIAEYRDRLMAFLSEAGPVRMAALEGGAYNASGRVFQLGGVSAVTQLCFWDLGIPFLEPTPQHLKAFVTGRYDADKEAVQHAVEKTIGRRVTDNEADAWGLAAMARAFVTREVRTRLQARLILRLEELGRSHEQ